MKNKKETDLSIEPVSPDPKPPRPGQIMPESKEIHNKPTKINTNKQS